MRTRGFIALLIGSALSALILLTFPSTFDSSAEPLGDLVASSDLVILADVTGVTEGAAATDTDRSAAGFPLVARLAVRQVWKGEAGGTIEVPFEGCLSWPAPPSYESGSRVIAFLRRTGGGWATIQAATVAGEPDSPDDFDPSTSATSAAAAGSARRTACLPGLSTMAPYLSIVR